MEDIRRNYVKAGDGVYYLEETDRKTGESRYFDGVRYKGSVPKLIVKVTPNQLPPGRKDELDRSWKKEPAPQKTSPKKKTKVDATAV